MQEAPGSTHTSRCAGITRQDSPFSGPLSTRRKFSFSFSFKLIPILHHFYRNYSFHSTTLKKKRKKLLQQLGPNFDLQIRMANEKTEKVLSRASFWGARLLLSLQATRP